MSGVGLDPEGRCEALPHTSPASVFILPSLDPRMWAC
jgi:hypothetical protein